MTRDELIFMAEKAGFVICEKSRQHQPNCIYFTHYVVDEMLERFALLVASAERDACAKVCDDIDVQYEGEDVLATWCAAAIRARGQE